jgi:hypothetical protein
VLASIIEPTSKADSLWALAEISVEPADYRTVTRWLPVFANLLCARHYRRHVRPVPGWCQPVWCTTTCPFAVRRLLFEWR